MTPRLLAGLDEHALHGCPPAVLAGGAHAVNLPLAADRVAVLFARHAEKRLGPEVFKAHGLVAAPEHGVALHRPHIQVIALAVLSEGADLLQTEEF